MLDKNEKHKKIKSENHKRVKNENHKRVKNENHTKIKSENHTKKGNILIYHRLQWYISKKCLNLSRG